MAKKYYVLDTNILLSSPQSIYGFGKENVVCITDVTIEELNKFKDYQGELGYNARESIRILNDLKVPLDAEVPLGNGGYVSIINDKNGMKLPKAYPLSVADNQILNTILNYPHPGILVTNDGNMMVKARTLNIEVQYYLNEKVAEEKAYTGVSCMEALDNLIDTAYASGVDVLLPTVKNHLKENGEKPIENQYFLIRGCVNPKKSILCGYRKKDGLRQILKDNLNIHGITPRNAYQSFAIDALIAPPEEIPLVILQGSAGSGKSLLALAAGLRNVIDLQTMDTVLVTRNNVLFAEDQGFLPGTEMEKMEPLVRGIMDNFKEILRIGGTAKSLTNETIEDMIREGIISIESMAYMRGRSIPYTTVIVDEAQNTTPNQMLGLLSRVSENTKIILTGDPDQIDNHLVDRYTNGLTFAAERMKGSSLCAQVTFNESHCVRSPLAKEAAIRLVKRGK